MHYWQLLLLLLAVLLLLVLLLLVLLLLLLLLISFQSFSIPARSSSSSKRNCLQKQLGRHEGRQLDIDQNCIANPPQFRE